MQKMCVGSLGGEDPLQKKMATTPAFLPGEIYGQRSRAGTVHGVTEESDVTVDRSQVQCCKKQYCIGTWNVRSMNQGKLEVVNRS